MGEFKANGPVSGYQGVGVPGMAAQVFFIDAPLLLLEFRISYFKFSELDCLEILGFK